MKEDIWNIFKVLLLMGLLMLMAHGCKTQYVPVERVVEKTDTIVRVDTTAITSLRHILDSVRTEHYEFVKDSMAISFDSTGVKVIERWHDRLIRDNNNAIRSVTDSTAYYKAKCDSIYKIHKEQEPQIVEVEKSLCWWDKLKVDSFWVLVIMVVCLSVSVWVNYKDIKSQG